MKKKDCSVSQNKVSFSLKATRFQSPCDKLCNRSFQTRCDIKPLSHQGGVLTVIPRRPEKCRTPRCAQYERKHHRSNAVASPLDAVGSHRTPSDGAHFEHTQNKHRRSVFARRPNRAQRGHHKVTIAAQ